MRDVEEKRQNNGTEKESDNVMEQRRREMGVQMKRDRMIGVK